MATDGAARRPLVTAITQVGMVVRDVEATVRWYWDELGVGPWEFYTLDPRNTPGMTLRGRPVEHAFRAALAMVGPVQLELIQPLDGDSLYAEHLARHGEGVHHLGFATDDLGETSAALDGLGYSVVQSGETFGIGRYVYFDTDSRLGVVAELGARRPGTVFPPPEGRYPE